MSDELPFVFNHKLLTNMKKLLLLTLVSMLLFACKVAEKEKRWLRCGELNTVRIDDDAEYHFSTDGIVRQDVEPYYVSIERSKKVSIPYLYVEQTKRSKWDEDYPARYKLVLPIGYKIETFND